MTQFEINTAAYTLADVKNALAELLGIYKGTDKERAVLALLAFLTDYDLVYFNAAAVGERLAKLDADENLSHVGILAFHRAAEAITEAFNDSETENAARDKWGALNFNDVYDLVLSTVQRLEN